MKKINFKRIFSWKWLLIIIVIILLAIISSKTKPTTTSDWQAVIDSDRPQFAPGWGERQSVGINSDKWEDGAYISGDGNTLYYAYYPGDLYNDVLSGKFKDDIDVYYSQKPFTKSKKHPISEDFWSEGGVMMSGSDIYYMSNRNRLGTDDIYKNGQAVIDTTNKQELDPHYCAAKNELYFWIEGVGNIYVYKNNQTKILPASINDGNRNIQPFLTSDCQEMYFSSTRDGGNMKIFKSKRLGEEAWAKPELVAKSQIAVGEPTLTDDGQTMFFVQIFRSPEGVLNTDIFYVERTK